MNEDVLLLKVLQDANGEYGPDVGSGIHALELMDSTAIIRNHTGGERLLPPCPGCPSNRTEGVQVAVRDVFGHTITGGIADSSKNGCVRTSRTHVSCL